MLRLLQETSPTQTFSKASGDRCRVSLVSSGPVGIDNTFPPCKAGEIGQSHCNVQDEDLVLLKDKQVARNKWCLARITSAFASDDGKVRSVKVKVSFQNTIKMFVRPT